MSVATQHSYTPLEGFKQEDSKKKKKNQTSFAEERSCAGTLVHARPSRKSKITGKGFLSLGLRSGSHLSEELVEGKVSKFHFQSITAKGLF